MRALLRIAGEGRELALAGQDPREHVLRGLARAVDASVGVICVGEIVEDLCPRLAEVVSYGWRTETEESRLIGYYLEHPPSIDPLVTSVLRDGAELVTKNSGEAQACPYIDYDLHRQASVDASMVSIRRLSDGMKRLIVLKRARGEKPFEDEDCEAVDVFRAEYEDLLGAMNDAPKLSPRERETLDLLLTGQPEKLIAASMGLSIHTTHDHVKAVYRKLGVRSRAELMAAGRQLRLRKTA